MWDYICFRKFDFIKVATVFYLIGSICLVIGGLGIMMEESVWGGLAMMLGGPVALHLVMEPWVIIFSIHQELKDMNKKIGDMDSSIDALIIPHLKGISRAFDEKREQNQAVHATDDSAE